MISNVKNWMKQNDELVEGIGGFLLMGLLGYMLYFSLWVFCPCG